MAFTYDLGSSDAAILLLSQVRLEIGDSVEYAGVLPDGGNLADEEITFILDQNDDDVPATVSALTGILARRWATAVDVAVGPRRESLSQVAKRWQELAAAASSGADGEVLRSFGVPVVRSDGYSAAASAAEYS